MEALRVGLIASPGSGLPDQVWRKRARHRPVRRGLTVLGCHMVLFGTGDLTCPVERRWLHPEALGTSFDLVAELRHIHAADDALDDVDVVHDHTILGPQWAVINDVVRPVVSTVHGEFSPELEALYHAVGPKVALGAISHAQRRSAPRVPVRRVIHHGLDLSAYPAGQGDGGYLLFMGRMNANKGAHRASSRTGAPASSVAARPTWSTRSISWARSTERAVGLGPRSDSRRGAWPPTHIDLYEELLAEAAGAPRSSVAVL